MLQHGHPLYTLTRRLQGLRHQLHAIRRGKLSVLVAMNTSWLDTTVTVLTRWSTGVIVEDRLGSDRTLTVGGGGHLELRLASRATFLFTQTDPETRPSVLSLSPHHDGWFQDQYQEIEIGFDQPLQPASSSYFSFDPPISFNVDWRNQDTAVLTPTSPWPNSGTWRLRVDAALTAQDGQQLDEDFESILHSGLGDAGLNLPSGFAVQVMMPFNMHHPLGLEVLPGEPTGRHPRVDDPLVGDVERKRILSLRPNQRASSYARRPEFLNTILSIARTARATSERDSWWRRPSSS